MRDVLKGPEMADATYLDAGEDCPHCY